MKRLIPSILLVVALFTSCKQQNDNTVEIGAIVPLTGTVATNGEAFMKGLEMGVEDANLNGGIQLKLNVEDCRSTAKDAHTAYRKLKGQGIKYFIGLGGQFVAGFASETNNSDEILFASATPNSTLLQMTNRCFRVFPTVDMVTDKICEYIDSVGANKIAIAYMQFEAYSMYYENILTKLKSSGKNVVYTEGYDPANRDFKGIVNKLASTHVDILYTAGAGESSSVLTRQLFGNPRTANIPVVGDMNFSNPENLNIIGTIKAPMCAIDNYIDPAFAERFVKKYNQNANSFALYGYVIASLLEQAIDSMDKEYSTDDVYEYIRTHTFETVGGPISFNPETKEPNLQLIYKVTRPNE